MSLLASSRNTSRWAFEKGARIYERSWLVNHFLGEWDRRIMELNPEPPLLDLGCATGRLFSKLTTNGYPGIYGFDLSLNCLRILKGKFPDKALSLSRGYIEDLPYKPESFSSALLSGVIHHLEDPAEALDEIAGILKPSGKLYVAEPLFPFGARQLINLFLDIYPLTGDRRFYNPEIIVSIADRHGFRKKELIARMFSFILILEKC